METKQLPVLQRLSNVESSLDQTGRAMDAMFQQLRNSLGSTADVFDSFVTLLSKEFPEKDLETKLRAAVVEKEKARALEKSEQQKANLASLVTAGVLKPVDTVTEHSVLVARIFDKDGTVTGTGRLQLEFSQLLEPLKPQFLGQGVGFMFETDNKEKFEILEVYDVVPEDQRTLKAVPDSAPATATVPIAVATSAPVVPAATTETVVEVK